MDKDWLGNKQSAFSILGARVFAQHDRAEHDYYATSPEAVEELLKVEKFTKKVWECACGEGHISKVLEAHGYEVISTDLIDRGFGEGYVDFLKTEKTNIPFDIVTNPPYKFAKEFAEKAIEVIADGRKVAMLLKIQFLESVKRRELFDKHPPMKIYVFSRRVGCALNGDFEATANRAMCFAWFVWQKGYTGDAVVKWIN